MKNRLHLSKRFISAVTAFMLFASLGISAFGASPSRVHAESQAQDAATGEVYYVDATGGDDSNGGQSEGEAWQSLEKVNATSFEPGDRILFKAGEVWIGQLAPKGSGQEGAPIVIDQYGSGSKPKIEGRGTVDSAVYLFNQSYWELNNLDVSNAAPVVTTSAESLDDFRGIHITGDNGTQLKHFRLNDLYIHDVSGEINWISGSIPEQPQPGINFKTGWDRSKRTGGIVFDTSVADPVNPGNPTTFDDVVIENSTIQNTSFGGIIFKQYAGTNEGSTHVGWGERASATDVRFSPHTNITIRDNYLSQYDTDYGCNSIYLTGVRGALIERNIVAGAGTSGIEMYYADDVVVQYNEVYETKRKAGGADHNGIDPDKATTKILIQYNYVHDTGDGILLCQFGFGDTVVRYNVIQNTERYPIYLHSDSKAVAEVYNNVIYNARSKYMIYGYGSYVNAVYNIYNNVLYSTKTDAVFTTGGGIQYDNNSYYGADFAVPAEDVRAIKRDPMLAAVGTGGKGTIETGPALSTLAGYMPKSGSPLIGAGKAVADNGGLDVLGQTLYNGTPDIGAIEYYGAPDSLTESITGTVKDTYGNRVANATISVEAQGTPYNATTDRTGYFALLNIPVGTGYSLQASKSGYNPDFESVDVLPGNTLSGIELAIDPTTAFGGVTGIVRNGMGDPLEGATVLVANEDGGEYEGMSDEEGHYVIENVATGAGYAVTASKEGYRPARAEGIEVTPAHLAPVADLFLTGSHPDYQIIEDFEAIGAGSLPEGWTVSQSGGSIVVVGEPEGENQALKLTRTTNSGSTSFAKSYGAGDLKGIVTVEAEIMRRDTESGASWVSVPYIYAVGNSSPSISFAFDKGIIKAYNGGASQNIMSYEAGKWYNVQIVMNLIQQKFDLFIDGELKLENASFRARMDEIGKIEFYANSSNKVEAYLDNIRVVKGTPYAKNDASLESLSIDRGELKQISETSYTLDAEHYMDQLRVTAAAASKLARSIEINGQPVTNGEPSGPIELQDGETEINVVVTAEDGVTVKTYTITIVRTTAAQDTSLRSITLSAGELTPEFDASEVAYTVSAIPTGTKELRVLAVPYTAAVSVSVDGVEAAGDGWSSAIALTDDHTVTVRVTSQDGTAYRDYTLLIEAPDNGGGIEGSAELTGPHAAAVNGPIELSLGATGLSGMLTLTAELAYDPSKISFPLKQNDAGTPDDATDDYYSLAEAAYTVTHSQLQVLTTGVKPELGKLFIVMASQGEGAADGALLKLHGQVLSEAEHGPTSIRVQEMTAANAEDAFSFDVQEAAVQIVVHLAEKSDLAAWIDSAEQALEQAVIGSQPGQYPQAAVDALFAAIQTAKAAAAEPGTTPEQANASVAALQAAVNDFRQAVIPNPDPDPADKTALAAAIKAAKKLHDVAQEGGKVGQYATGSKSTLQNAINTAEAVHINSSASQTTVDQATKALNEAMQSFSKTRVTLVEGESQITIRDLAIISKYYGATSDDDNWSEIEKADLFGEGITLRVLAAVAQMILDDWMAQ